MNTVGEFTQEIWNNISDIYNDIINSKYVRDLASGSLAEESFKHYLSQDVLYIQKDTIALELISNRAIDKMEKDFFLKMSKDCMEIENILHNEFLDYFQVKAAKEQSPAFSAYSNFLLDQVNTAAFPVAVAALLPCFWVYGKVGNHILDTQSPNNKYQKFIDTYSGDEYINYTRQFINITESHGQKADSSLRQEIINAFITSSKHELLVFEESTNQKPSLLKMNYK